jgi:hypothetical protein
MIAFVLFLLFQFSGTPIRSSKTVIVKDVDVPSITITVPAPYPCNLSPQGNGYGAVEAICVTGPEQHETCENKARVLLHSEDGKGHCVLFSAIQQEISVFSKQ